jgi:hypothetical protein
MIDRSESHLIARERKNRDASGGHGHVARPARTATPQPPKTPVNKR